MRQRLFAMRILWLGIATASVLFLAVLRVGDLPSKPPDSMMVAAIAAAALADLVVSVILPARLLGAALRGLSGQIVERAEKRAFAEPQPANRAITAALQSPFILGLALTESVALFGLALGRLGAPFPVVLPFFAVAWVGFALRFPTQAKIAAAVKKHLDVDLPP
ncbi:MAG TPA: hypothetical protein VF316_09890 [Polyangiaceae bacterium]